MASSTIDVQAIIQAMWAPRSPGATTKAGGAPSKQASLLGVNDENAHPNGPVITPKKRRVCTEEDGENATAAPVLSVSTATTPLRAFGLPLGNSPFRPATARNNLAEKLLDLGGRDAENVANVPKPSERPPSPLRTEMLDQVIQSLSSLSCQNDFVPAAVPVVAASLPPLAASSSTPPVPSAVPPAAPPPPGSSSKGQEELNDSVEQDSEADAFRRVMAAQQARGVRLLLRHLIPQASGDAAPSSSSSSSTSAQLHRYRQLSATPLADVLSSEAALLARQARTAEAMRQSPLGAPLSSVGDAALEGAEPKAFWERTPMVPLTELSLVQQRLREWREKYGPNKEEIRKIDKETERREEVEDRS